jgi:hypothetical protein
MATIAEFIDSQIKNPTPISGLNLYSKIDAKIKQFKGIIDNDGVLNPNSYSGIDALVCRRVAAMYSKQYNTTDSTVVKKSLADSKKSSQDVFSKTDEEEYAISGFITWSGNEALICPWLKEYVSPDGPNTISSSNPYKPSQSFQYTKFSKGIKFNTSSTLTSQNKTITVNSNRLANFNKTDKRMYIGVPNKKTAYVSPGTDAQYTSDLSLYITADHWCIGKMLIFGNYVVTQIFTFASERELNCFEKPKFYTATQSDGLGFTANAYLLFVPLTGGTSIKLESNDEISQNKLDIIKGYTDFIVHKGKLFCTKTISSDDIEFSGFRLGTKEDVEGYVKITPPIKYTFKNYKFGLFELTIQDNSIIETLVYSIDIPEQTESKFAISGSKLMYTTIKLAANNICPYTFYFQIFYELVFQLPYDYSMKFYGSPCWEGGLGRYLRTSANLDDVATNDVLAKDIETLYGSEFFRLISTIKYGSVNKITGHIYLEVPLDVENSYEVKTKNSPYADIIYETVGESKPSYSPLNNDWKVWYLGSNAAAIDLYVIWHLASGAIGTGDAKTPTIVSDLGLEQFSSNHPSYTKLKDIKESGVEL